ncbi:GNAT family N-acetyltransferase [Arthrobacter sp. zg-Y750]|nr:GNAT family N-acetyltransferase [Arthrobacter sp. zg-Y750]
MSQFIPTPPIKTPAPVPFAAPGQRAAPAAPQPSLHDTLRTLRPTQSGDQKPRQVSLLRDDPAKPDVISLLAQNRDLLYPGLGAGAVGLTPPYLKDPSVTFWTVRENGTLLGCGAMKEFRPAPGNGITEFCAEITSMRTSPHARGLGVGQVILQQIISDARTRGYASLLLETGTQDFFASSRRLYQRHGFVVCPPFGKYQAHPGSIFMRLALQAPAETAAESGSAAATGSPGAAADQDKNHAKAGTLSAILAAQRALAAKPNPRTR